MIINKIIASLNSLLRRDSVKLSGVILFLCLIIYHQFLIGGDFFLWSDLGSDTLNSYWPAYTYFSNAIRQGPVFLSLELGLGINIFSGSLLFFDPFMWLYALADMAGIARLLIIVHVLKLLIGALFFQQYLGFFLKSRYVIFIFSLLYAFNSFMMIWGQHFYFGTIVMIFPIILLGIEKFIQKEKFLLLTLSISLGLISSYYFMYMAVFFLGVYIPARLLVLNGKNYSIIVKKLFTLGCFFIAGVGISAVITFPTVAATLTTARVKAQMINFSIFSLGDIRNYLSIVGSFFSNNLLGSAESFIGQANYYDSPHLYSGILTLLIIPQILTLRNRRDKVFTSILLTFSAIALFFPFAAVMFNGFSTFSYRWTYFLILFFLLSASIAFESLEHNHPVNKPLLKVTFFLLALASLAVNAVYFLIREPIQNGQIHITASVISDTMSRILPVIFFLVAYFILILKYSNWKYSRYLLTLVIVIEIIWSSSATILGRSPVSIAYINNKIGYFDQSVNAISELKRNDHGFYRVDKSYFSQFWNDSLMQDYKSYHAYWSIIPGSSLDFFGEVGGGTAMGTQLGFISSDIIRSLLSVKYFLVKSIDQAPQDYEFIGKYGDVYLFKNNHWVPMGAVYHNFISKSDFNRKTISDRDNILAFAGVIPDELVGTAREKGLLEISDPTNQISNSSILLNSAQTNLKKLASESLSLTISRDDFIEGTLSPDTMGIMFFPLTYDKGWEIYIDDKKTSSIDVNWGLLGLWVEPGVHKITLRYIPALLREGAIVSILSISSILFLFIFRHKRPWRSSIA